MQAATPAIRVMLLDGESSVYHDWKTTTPALRRMLEETGLFRVDVVTAPAASGELQGFAPVFTDYDVVVFNYDAPDGRWPAPLQRAFEAYMEGGGGLVLVHAANNAFPGWPAFNAMAGIGGWRERDEDAGPRWYVEANGALAADDSPGRAGTHGRRIPYPIEVRADHPITRGLPRRWMHAGDELYANLRGPGGDMTILATAYSDPANQGSGRHEPQLLVVRYGAGRVFHTTLGHDLPALASVDFIVTFQRGTQWAASGKVTQPLPPDFPAGAAVRQRPQYLP